MNNKADWNETETADLLGRMQGLTVALCTPLDAQYKLDVEGLEKLIERVIEGGASCLLTTLLRHSLYKQK